MKLITWNCQGIGGDLTVDNLLESNRLHTPDIVILLETKNKSYRYEFLKRRLGLDYMFAVEPQGLSGGLCVFWKDGSQVTLLKAEEFVIEVKIWDGNLNKQWRLFAIYASTDEKKRKEQWTRLGKRIEQDRDCCLLIGDFNDILCNEEKEGGNYRPASSMRDFREFVARNELMDLGYEGYPFTWRNNRESQPIQQRLDRGLATMGWNNTYPDTTIRHLVLEGSDHAMLLLSTEKLKAWRGRKFSYDARWSKLKECRELVAQDWENNSRGSHAFRLCEKLKKLRTSLKVWYKGRGRNSKTAINNLKDEIRRAYMSNQFASEESCRPSRIQEIEDCMEARVTPEDNRDLMSPISDEEILEAAFQIPSTRAPGPDADMVKTIKAFWHSGTLLRKLNHTNLVLIPKVKCPRKMTQFRPIALCNVSYKILAKSQDSQIGMAIKLDMAKAYDRVEWDFLLSMMTKLGFASMFCNRVMECISTVSFSILINGSPMGYIHPTRGLRQGDPLSPFLFLICAEGFSSLIRKGLELLFGNATIEEAQGVADILKMYASGSGQEINMSKSSIFFGTATSKRNKKKIGETLGIQHKDGFGKYLGLQADFGLSKKAVFAEIRDKIESRLAGWSEQFLSQAGKEVLVKAVAMALPNYAMSCFKLPIGVCRDVEKAVRSYWWKGNDQKRGCHWISWDRLMKQKRAGGLGWRVGDGENIDIRKDPWLPTPTTFLANPLDSLEVTKVRELIEPISKSWKAEIIVAGFNQEEARKILSIPLSKTGCRDRLVWHHTVNGVYSVKTGYGVAINLMENGALGRKGRGAPSENRRSNPMWRKIWTLQVPNKIKYFIWKCCNNALAVRQNLQRRHMRVENICGVCNSVGESENHLFFHCDFSQRFWFGSHLYLNSHKLAGVDFLESWETFCNRIKSTAMNEEILQEFAFGLWRLWKNRNEVVFNGVHRPHLEVLTLWKRNIAEYREALLPSLAEDSQLHVKPHKMVNRMKSHWKKPTFGTIKINTDAAWCRSSLRTGVGWVGRDFAGLLQFAGGSGNGLCHSAVAAEASAIRCALLACIDHGYEQVTIESDALVLIQMLKKESTQDYSIECILGDIETLVQRLTTVTFAFAPRESNRAAHSVAKYAFQHGGDFVWNCIGPEFLFNILAQDVNIPIRL
ncbi:unnamed protein product [Malus baccata var. baccata]